MVKAVGYTCIMRRAKAILIVFFLLFGSTLVFSQAKDEAELKKAAAKAFEDEEYAQGFKLYSTLVANYPKDPEYNYRLGVCALYSEADKKKPLGYLQLAAKQPKEVEKEVFFYLGKACHINYLFDDAIKYYSQYKSAGSSSMQKKLQVDREIQCCKNGKRLLTNLQELVILDKKQLAQSDYFRSYDLRDIGGKLLAKPADFITANDKKKKDRSIVFLPASKDQLYYASYGTGDNKDLFIVRRLPSGEWSKPEPLPGEVNTEFDEDFPFLHPNGKVLYFASKGHNSMGGFDIFKSEFDEGSGRWKTPVNLDFPINSPNDDYLFVTDSLEKIAYLASTRQSPAGKVDVIKILTERRAAEYAYIKGSVVKKDPSQNIQSKIKVKNIETGEDASFDADVSGEYNIRLANGGKFIFTVETPGMPTQSQGVEIPVSYNYKPYRQTIEYDNQKLVITSFFSTDDKNEENYVQYLTLIEEKSKMNVNASDFDINPDNPLDPRNNAQNPVATNTTAATNPEITNTNTTTATTHTTSGGNVSNKQLVEIAYSDAKDSQKEADELKKDAATAFTAANSKQDQANETRQELQEVQGKINTETNPTKKQELTEQADKLKQEADLYDKQAKTANTIAQQLGVDAKNKQKEADLNLQYAKALEEADKTKNNKQAIAKLEDLQKQLAALDKEQGKSNALVESIKTDAENKEKELKVAENKQEKINKEETDLKTQITDIDSQIEKTKDKTLVENLKAQKEDLSSDLAEKQKESQGNQNKINTLKEESDALRSQAEYASNIAAGKTPVEDVKTSPTNTNTVSATNTNTVAATNTNTVSAVGTNTVSGVGTNTVAATNTNTVSAVNTNTVSSTNTNTVSAVATNTVDAVNTTTTVATNSVTTDNEPVTYQDKAKQLDESLTALNNLDPSVDNSKKKIGLLKEYVQDIDVDIKEKKQLLGKIRNKDDKARLNAEIKELNDKKADLQKQERLANTELKEQEKQAAIAAKNNGKDSSKTNVTAPPVTDTAQVKILADNDDPRIQNINTLLDQSQNNFSAEKKVSNFGYTDTKAQQLKRQADDKLNELYKNNAMLEQQLEQLKIDIAKDNAGNNDKKIEQLNKQANDLTAQAFQLRKDAKTLGGAEKQNAISKILALEKQAAGFHYQAARLQYMSDDDNYETNKQVIDRLILEVDKSGSVAQQVSQLTLESEKAKKDALRLREEAEAQGEVEAKIGALSNADEKEKEALKKQEEALVLLKGPNAGTVATTKDKQIEDIKSKLGKEVQSSVTALKLLVDANKAEYTALLNEVSALEKKSGSKPEELAAKTEGQNTFKLGTDENNKVGSLREDKQKRELLIDVNAKLEEAITQLRKAKQILTGEEVIATNTNTVTVNPENNNTVNTNTVAVSTNTTTVNPENNNTVGTNTVAATNTVSANPENNNTVNTNTVAVTNTVSTNPGNINPVNTNSATAGNNAKLNDQQVRDVKASAEYQKYTALQGEAAKYNETARNNEAAAQEYKATYESVKAEADKAPAGTPLKQQKENEAMALKNKSDSLQNAAANSRSLADAKKQEASTYVQSLDKQTQDNVVAVANTEPGNTITPPQKYTDYSPAYRTNATQNDEKLASLRDKTSTPENLKEQNQVIATYIQDIDKEIAAKKKEQTAARTPAEKTKLAQQVSNLQTRKTELTNEKTTNDNIIKFASNNNPNVANTNTVSANNNTNPVNTNTVAATNNTTPANTNTVAANNNTTPANTNTVAANNNTNPVNTNTVAANNNTSPVNTNTVAANPVNTNTVAANNNVSPANAGNAIVAPTKGFEVKRGNAYSNANPIPVNEKFPDGLVFRVQIGAFKNPIAPERFAGLAPVGAETTTFGFMRYQVGLFTDYQQANAVKNDLRKLKYNDAFVVAYRNGKRIPLTEALDSLAKTGTDVITRANTTAGIDQNSNIPVNPEANNVARTNAPANISGTLNTTQGLLFTVQVGVYAENIPADRLYNLKPLFTEALPTGYFRYTAGIYNNIDKVKADRARVNALGIKDAFVSAYLDGQKIKISDALDKLNAGNVKFPAENPIQFGDAGAVVETNTVAPANNTPANNTPANNTPANNQPANGVQPFSNGVTEGPAPTPENGVKTTEEGITYKVQIGAYSKQVPVNVVNNWLKIKNWPIKSQAVNGLYLYTVGSFTEAKFAQQLRQEVYNMGITDAFMVVYKDGRKLSAAEAAPYMNR